MYYLSLILNLFSFYLNIEIPFKIYFDKTKPFILFKNKSNSLFLNEDSIKSSSSTISITSKTTTSSSSSSSSNNNNDEIKNFKFSLNLFNENILSICHSQGISILEENKKNFQINFLTLYHFENLGIVSGPFIYYNSNSNLIENLQNNYYISSNSNSKENSIIKFIQIEEKEKINSNQNKNPKGYFIDLDENHFGKNSIYKKEIEKSNDRFNNNDNDVDVDEIEEIEEIEQYF